MEFWLPLGIVAFLFAGLALLQRRHRRTLLARFRAEWGHPSERERDIRAIWLYHGTLATESECSLDERTGKDLDLDALFAVLDRTESTVGQQLLYHRLRTTPTSDNLEAFESLMVRLGEDARERERVQLSLARLRGHSGDLWWLTQPGVLDVKPRDLVFPLLAPVVPVALLLSVIWPQAFLVVIAGVLTNWAVRYVSAPRLGLLLHPFRQLGPVIAIAESLRPLIATDSASLGPSMSADARLSRLRRIASVVSRDPMLSDDLTNAVFELANVAMLLDVSALYIASREIQANGAALLRTIATVGTVDAAHQRRLVPRRNDRLDTPGLSVPVSHLDDERPTSPAAGRGGPELHHTCASTRRPRDWVEHVREVHLLRTIGVNAVLAQTVNTCLATTYSAPVFTVRSVIGRGDDLLSGTSYYKDEVEAVLAIVHLSRSRLPHLFLFDELFRGTSTAERIAAGEAVLAELISHDQEDKTGSPHIVIAATHDRELVDLLRHVYAAYHFSDTVGSGGLLFDYKLREGPARSRNAIALLELYGAPPQIVQRARARLADPET